MVARQRADESFDEYLAREHAEYFEDPPLPWGRRARTGTWHLYLGRRRVAPHVGMWQTNCSVGHAFLGDDITWANLPDPEGKQACRRCLATWTLKRRCNIEGERVMVKGGTPKAATKQEALATILFVEAARREKVPDASANGLWDRFVLVLADVGLRIVLVDEDGQP